MIINARVCSQHTGSHDRAVHCALLLMPLVLLFCCRSRCCINIAGQFAAAAVDAVAAEFVAVVAAVPAAFAALATNAAPFAADLAFVAAVTLVETAAVAAIDPAAVDAMVENVCAVPFSAECRK